MNMNQKGFANVLIIIAVLILLSGGVGYFTLIRTPEPVTQQNAAIPSIALPTTIPTATTTQNMPPKISQAELNEFTTSLCPKEKFATHITEGHFFESNLSNQFFVHCEIPQPPPGYRLEGVGGYRFYIVGWQKTSGFKVYWSKSIGFADGDNSLRSVEKPEVVDVDKDGLSEIYWGGAIWGGTCAPHSSFGYLFDSKQNLEFSVQKSYEFDKDCTNSSILVETKFSPNPSTQNSQRSKLFYDYLTAKSL